MRPIVVPICDLGGRGGLLRLTGLKKGWSESWMRTHAPISVVKIDYTEDPTNHLIATVNAGMAPLVWVNLTVLLDAIRRDFPAKYSELLELRALHEYLREHFDEFSALADPNGLSPDWALKILPSRLKTREGQTEFTLDTVTEERERRRKLISQMRRAGKDGDITHLKQLWDEFTERFEATSREVNDQLVALSMEAMGIFTAIIRGGPVPEPSDAAEDVADMIDIIGETAPAEPAYPPPLTMKEQFAPSPNGNGMHVIPVRGLLEMGYELIGAVNRLADGVEALADLGTPVEHVGEKGFSPSDVAQDLLTQVCAVFDSYTAE
jgi:hypothetical protein